MSLSTLFGANLTPYANVELWITRSCLLISAAIIGPTVILIILDLCLWIIRAGHGPSSELLRRSKSGISDLHQRARRRSRSNSGASSAGSVAGSTIDIGMTTRGGAAAIPSRADVNDAHTAAADDFATSGVPRKRLDGRLRALADDVADDDDDDDVPAHLEREETNPVGGISNAASATTTAKDVANPNHKSTQSAVSSLGELKLGKVIE